MDTPATSPAKNTLCLWYHGDAEVAARFYASVFPASKVKAVHRAPSDYPAGKQGDALTVEFTVLGIPCLGLNGGPGTPHGHAFSFQVAKRAFEAMMQMRKIDVAAIEAARRG